MQYFIKCGNLITPHLPINRNKDSPVLSQSYSDGQGIFLASVPVTPEVYIASAVFAPAVCSVALFRTHIQVTEAPPSKENRIAEDA